MNRPRPSSVRSTRDIGHRSSIFGNVLSMSVVEGSERSFLTSNIVLPLMVSLLLLFGGSYILPGMMLNHFEGLDDFFKPLTSAIKFKVYAPALSIIPVSMFLKWGFFNLTASFVKHSEEDAKKTGWWDVYTPSQSSTLLFCAVTIHHMRSIAQACVQDIFLETTSTLLDSALAFALFATWVSVLDDAYAGVFAYACQLETIPLGSPKTPKWEGIMKDFCRFGDKAIDKGYSIPGGSRSSALVLSEIFGVYINIGKLAGFITLALFFVGIDLYTNLFIIGISVFLTGLIAALRINDAIATVLPLAMSNTLHIGEIVSISRPGYTPSDNPEKHLVGFVEGITWSHTVIRDFRSKQTFVPHAELQKLVVANWSRRPAKVCRFRLQVVPGLKDGAASLAKLAKFCRNWLEKHTGIDQNKYQKSVIKMASQDTVPLLEVIFYPKVGVSASNLRSEFTFMIMDATKRLDICLMPAEVGPKTAGNSEPIT
jgi:small-conductance mechanosensitive channel